jgi:hypothetical protein
LSARDTRVSGPTPHHSPDDHGVSPGPDRFSRIAAALDEQIWQHPYVVITTSNEAAIDPATGRAAVADDLDAARVLAEGLDDAASIAGNLRPELVGLDVDPAGDGAHWIGERVANQLATWCDQRDLPWWVRESGRPGGRHVIIKADVAQQRDLRARVRQLAAEHRCAIRICRALRLLTAPHRLGLPSPSVAGTLRPHHLPPREPAPARTGGKGRDRRKRRAERLAARFAEAPATTADLATGEGEHRGVPGMLATPDGIDSSPSAATFGRACWSVRAGASKAAAWATALAAPELAQVTERGQDDWSAFVYLPAATTVAAEKGLDEAEAWAEAQAAHWRRCRELGRDGWRVQLWEPALAAAATDRPRRYTDPDAASDQAKRRVPRAEQEELALAAEVAVLRFGLRAAAERWAGQHGRRPQVLTTMTALLDAVAEAIVHDHGRIGQRRLAEMAGIGDATLYRRLKEALAARLLYRVATYRDDAQPCDSYGVGPAAQALVQGGRETGGRSCTPPRAPTTGTADPAKAQARHQAQRRAWRSTRPVTSSSTEAIEKIYPDRDHPVSALVRSRMRQVSWWASLTETERTARRAARRALLDDLPADDRASWLEWLARRELIDASIRHLLDGTDAPIDHAIVAAAPMTVHHGRRDPAWRTGGTPRPLADGARPEPMQGELALFGAAPAPRSSGPSRHPRGRPRAPGLP